MAEKDKTVLILATTFIVGILALVLLSSLAEQTNLVTTKVVALDEAYNLTGIGCYQGGQVNGTTDANCNITVTYAPTSWETTDCPLTSVVVTNTTGTVLTANTDYVLYASTGLVQLLNTTSTAYAAMGNNVLIDYTYCGSGYLNSSWGRSILGVNAGLYAIAILILVVSAVYIILKKKSDED